MSTGGAGREWSSYRVFDNSDGQIRKWSNLLKGTRPLVADGNPFILDGEGPPQQAMNHSGVVHVLMGDGAIIDLTLDGIDELKGQGPDALMSLVGPLADHSQGKYKALIFDRDG
ncbi:MAG: hypothetical protein H6834_08580 [Planctomycetes bacterium]|nr:hypothetical protein [Planctomycetota bacterium]